jgi:hypothetical protein
MKLLRTGERDVSAELTEALALGGHVVLQGPDRYVVTSRVVVGAPSRLTIEAGVELACEAQGGIRVYVGTLDGDGRIVGRTSVGVIANDKALVRDVTIEGFEHGLSIVGNHQRVYSVKVTECDYNLWFGPNADDFGDQTFLDLDLTGARKAGVLIDPSNTIDNAEFIGGHCGWSPYGFLRTASRGRHPGKQMLTSTSFKGFAFECIGNAAIYDESGTREVSSCVFENCGMSWSEGVCDPGQSKAAAIDVGILQDVRFLGASSMIAPGTEAIIKARMGISNVVWEDGRWIVERRPPVVKSPYARGVFLVGGDGRTYDTSFRRAFR